MVEEMVTRLAEEGKYISLLFLKSQVLFWGILPPRGCF